MLSITELARLRRAAAGSSNLSVYLSGTETDPAESKVWKRRAQNVARSERERLLEAHGESECTRFDKAWKEVEALLPTPSGALGSPGWVAFADSERVLHASPLPMPCETLVSWGPGIRIAPYLREISRTPDLLLVLADVRRARVFRVADHDPVELEDLIADREVSEGAGLGMMKAAGSSSGVRGETRREAAHRASRTATDRMLRSLVRTVESRAESAAAIVLGGNERVTAALRDSLDDALADRVLIRPDLEVTMSRAEITEVLATLEADVKLRLDTDVVQSWSAADKGKGLSVAGWNDTMRALDEGAVDTLLLSASFVDDQRDDAEALVVRALETAGSIRELVGEPGRRLDEEGQGVGARLRFAPNLRIP